MRRSTKSSRPNTDFIDLLNVAIIVQTFINVLQLLYCLQTIFYLFFWHLLYISCLSPSRPGGTTPKFLGGPMRWLKAMLTEWTKLKKQKKILRVIFIILISREAVKILMRMLETSNAQGS